jgi:lambda family phage tail tape measure protein
LTQNIAKMKKELDDLVNPINQVTSAANAIGTAFSDSFKSVIDGSATTQEALAGFFKNIASYFLDMAMQIIQKMIAMAILNTVVGLLPGSGFNASTTKLGAGGGSVGGIGTLGPNFGFQAANGAYFDKGMAKFAKGGVFAKNKIVPYAKGGIVDKPTMFAYANGGAGNFGLMGEAGPEAIMPLQRGPGGKLGVQASGGGGVSVGNINITVENTGDKLNPAAQKQLAGQVQGIVLSTLANERRSGGML